MAKLIVWVVDDDDSIRWVLNRAFERAGFDTRDFANAELLLEALEDAKRNRLRHPHARCRWF